MRVSVVTCSCENPVPHYKLKGEDGRESRGFGSVEGGKRILARLISGGTISQTAEETAATTQAIEACGLPATDAESAKLDILQATKRLRETFPPDKWVPLVKQAFALGQITLGEGIQLLVALGPLEPEDKKTT